MKCIKIYIVVLVALLSSTSGATKPEIPSIKMDMKIEFASQPEINKPVTLTFTFTPMEEIKRANELNDFAKIEFDTSKVMFASGSPIWTGKLKKGNTESIQIVLKIIKGGIHNFLGCVYSVPESPSKVTTVPKEDIPKEGIFYYRNYINKSIRLGSALNNEDTTWQEINGTKIRKVTVVKPLSELGPPPKITGHNDSVVVPTESTTHHRQVHKDSVLADSTQPK